MKLKLRNFIEEIDTYDLDNTELAVDDTGDILLIQDGVLLKKFCLKQNLIDNIFDSLFKKFYPDKTDDDKKDTKYDIDFIVRLYENLENAEVSQEEMLTILPSYICEAIYKYKIVNEDGMMKLRLKKYAYQIYEACDFDTRILKDISDISDFTKYEILVAGEYIGYCIAKGIKSKDIINNSLPRIKKIMSNIYDVKEELNYESIGDN